MPIDQDSVKIFWDQRAKKYQELAFESIANLEQDPNNLQLKIKLETEKVFHYLGPVNGRTILDFGAGVGQWAFRFINNGALFVTAVEYSAALAEIGIREAERRNITNINFVVSPAEDFAPAPVAYDVVFISGLFVYMNDAQAEKLTQNLRKFCNSESILLLRDGTSTGTRHEINNKFSEHLQTMYSAIYRSRKEYIDLFSRHGFRLLKDEDMFEEGCPLNKYSETRLRIYSFAPSDSTGG